MIPLADTLKQHQAFIDVGYSTGNRYYRLNTTFDGLTVADSYLTIQRKTSDSSDDSFEIEYTIQPHDQGTDMIRLTHFEILFDTDLTDNTMMAEGFQAWTQTREMDKTSKLPAIQSTVAWITKFDLQGDYNFFKHSGKQGMIHSTGYTYLRDDNSILFLGSLSENNGYSYFKFDFDSHRFSLYKDIEGKTLPIGDTLTFGFLAIHHHDQTTLWKRYASRLLPSLATTPPVLTGWTSWYNFYEAVTEKDVMDSISGLMDHGYPVDLIQIDDGYETAIGDWLDVDLIKFPKGMKAMADEIKQRTKAIPGIWLAPFAVGLNSKIIKDHPHWLIYQPDGNPLLAGPNWGGFRALDIYQPEVRHYLKRVFDTVIDEWGYKFLKLDFIFAAAMIPRHGKSRGEIMWDSISLIDELVDKRALLLGCGVTLPSVWGRFDYSRVSSDASPWWDHSVLRMANVRERVATYNALVSTLNRWPMNNIMFGNDPDVFFIRSNNNQLTADERYTLVMVNNLLGRMALMSDNVALYSAEEHDLYSKTFPKAQITMERMDRIGPDVYRLHYECNGRPYISLVNLSPLPYRFLLPTSDSMDHGSTYFEYDNVLLKKRNNATRVQWFDAKDETPLVIRPHQTRTFMRIVDDFAGSTGHILPGWEVESIKGSLKDSTLIRLRQPRIQSQETHYYFKATEKTSGVFIDDKKSELIQPLDPNPAVPFPLIQVTHSY